VRFNTRGEAGEEVEMNQSPAVEWTLPPPLGTALCAQRERERERLYGHLEVGVPVITTVDRGVRGAAYLA
jgi:hypothetical protein